MLLQQKNGGETIRTNFFGGLFKQRFCKFLLVGGINTIFGYTIYGLGLFIGLQYALAVLIATVLGVLFNFKTFGKYVFANSDRKLFVKFLGVYIITYLLNTLILGLCHKYDYNLYLVQAVLAVPLACLSYSLNRNFVFGEKKHETN